MTSDPDRRTPPPNDSPGEHLAQVRRGRGLSVERIAQELRLRPGTVAAVEEDAYERLPSAVFVSGYIRAYARLLDIDPLPLIERFHRLHPNAEPPPPRVSRGGDRHVGAGHLLARLLVPTLVVVAIAALGYWSWQADWTRPLQSQRPVAERPSTPGPTAAGPEPTTQPTRSTPQLPPIPDPRPPEPLPAANVVADDPAVPPDDTEQSAGPSTRVPASTATATEPETPVPVDLGPKPIAATTPTDLKPAADEPDVETVPATTDTQPGGRANDDAEPDAASGDQVVLTFSGPCWVDVRDANGEIELFGEMADGDRRVLSGAPPFSLILGNAAAARIEVGGRAVDIAAIAKGNVARFDLDPAAPPEAGDDDPGPDAAPSG